MPCVQTKVINRQATLEVLFMPAGAWKNRKADKSKAILPNNIQSCQALIDSGASTSCISKYVADSLKIKPFEKILVQGVHGSQDTNVYVADMILLDVLLCVENIKLAEVNFPESNPYHALIGMDIISRGTLHFNYGSRHSQGKGICTFCV